MRYPKIRFNTDSLRTENAVSHEVALTTIGVIRVCETIKNELVKDNQPMTRSSSSSCEGSWKSYRHNRRNIDTEIKQNIDITRIISAKIVMARV